MSDATLNEEIARLEIEIDAVRDELDEAIKRNEGLEADVIRQSQEISILRTAFRMLLEHFDGPPDLQPESIEIVLTEFIALARKRIS